MTMLVVSHEMGFARSAASDVLFLDEGQIVEQGPPEQLFDWPERDRTRAFLRRFTHRGADADAGADEDASDESGSGTDSASGTER
jgi:ABC-type glutathione transport system ATPase component